MKVDYRKAAVSRKAPEGPQTISTPFPRPRPASGQVLKLRIDEAKLRESSKAAKDRK